jgi:hypothetical protein
MVTGLRSVSWEKVDVSFRTSMGSFAAHSIIQVSYPPSPCIWNVVYYCTTRVRDQVKPLFTLLWFQVKYGFMNEGADVIQHIIDHFQVWRISGLVIEHAFRWHGWPAICQHRTPNLQTAEQIYQHRLVSDSKKKKRKGTGRPGSIG